MAEPKKVTRKGTDKGIKKNFEHFATKTNVQISFSEKTLRKWLKEIEAAKRK